jgi:hypothetical protein
MNKQAHHYRMKKRILFHGKHHIIEMGEAKVSQFLGFLATMKTISAILILAKTSDSAHKRINYWPA